MKYKLEDICNQIYSGGTPSTSHKEYWGGNLPWLSSGETSQRFIYTTEKYITEHGVKNSSTKFAKKFSTVMASAGQGHTRGQTSFLMNDMYVNQSVLVFEPNTYMVEPLFLFYNLNGRYEELRQLSDGTSTRGSLSGRIVKGMEIDLPNLRIQKKIVNILYGIDKKIEINTKINRNLSKQADALFDEWFGRYFFELSDIPDGWKQEEIGKLDVLVTDYVANGSFKSLADNVHYQSEETGNVLIRLTDYNNNYSSDMIYISDQAYEFLSKSKLFGDEIIISNVGANVGTVFRCPRLRKRMSLGPNSIMLRSDTLEHYLFLYFTSAYGQHQLQSIVTGSAQPKFNKTNFRAMKVLIPTNEVLSSFNEIYAPIYDMIAKNNAENGNLIGLRDSLLPKLMSGELDVNGLEI